MNSAFVALTVHHDHGQVPTIAFGYNYARKVILSVFIDHGRGAGQGDTSIDELRRAH